MADEICVCGRNLTKWGRTHKCPGARDGGNEARLARGTVPSSRAQYRVPKRSKVRRRNVIDTSGPCKPVISKEVLEGLKEQASTAPARGRPRGAATVSIPVRLEAALVERLDRYAEAHDQKRSAAIRALIEAGLGE